MHSIRDVIVTAHREHSREALIPWIHTGLKHYNDRFAPLLTALRAYCDKTVGLPLPALPLSKARLRPPLLCVALARVLTIFCPPTLSEKLFQVKFETRRRNASWLNPCAARQDHLESRDDMRLQALAVRGLHGAAEQGENLRGPINALRSLLYRQEGLCHCQDA